jgi:hypothetical protein
MFPLITRPLLPSADRVHIPLAASPRLRRQIHPPRQPERHVPVRRPQNANVQQPSHGIERRPPERPGPTRRPRRPISIPAPPRPMPVQMAPRKTRHQPVRPMLASHIRIAAKQLHEIVMLKLMNRFERPIPPSHVKIRVDPRPVLPIRGKPLDRDVQNILFVPQLIASAKLHVIRIPARDLKRPLPVSEFPRVRHHIRTQPQMLQKIVGERAPGPPSQRIAVRARYVQRGFIRPFLPGLVNIRMPCHLALKIRGAAEILRG